MKLIEQYANHCESYPLFNMDIIIFNKLVSVEMKTFIKIYGEDLVNELNLNLTELKFLIQEYEILYKTELPSDITVTAIHNKIFRPKSVAIDYEGYRSHCKKYPIYATLGIEIYVILTSNKFKTFIKEYGNKNLDTWQLVTNTSDEINVNRQSLKLLKNEHILIYKEKFPDNLTVKMLYNKVFTPVWEKPNYRIGFIENGTITYEKDSGACKICGNPLCLLH